jgi:hypothetical protein
MEIVAQSRGWTEVKQQEGIQPSRAETRRELVKRRNTVFDDVATTIKRDS